MHIQVPILAFLAVCMLVGWMSEKSSDKIKFIPSIVWMLVYAMGVNVALPMVPGGETIIEAIRGEHPSDLMAVLFNVPAILILFTVGLESSPMDLLKSSKVGAPAAILGVLTPMILVTACCYYAFGFEFGESIAAGGVSTATSVAICESVMAARKLLKTLMGAIVIAAAVIDDLMGVGILQAILSLFGVQAPQSAEALGHHAVHSPMDPHWLFTVAGLVVFVVVTVLARRYGGIFFRSMRTNLTIVREMVLLFWMLAFVTLAVAVGLEPILGAYAAGLVFDESFVSETEEAILGGSANVEGYESAPHHSEVEDFFLMLKRNTVPFFFVISMCLVDPSIFLDATVLLMGLALSALYVIGKLPAGLPAPRGQRLVVGVAMVPRGEVGIIFASACFGAGILPVTLFGPCIVAILVSTFVGAVALGPAIDWSERATTAT